MAIYYTLLIYNSTYMLRLPRRCARLTEKPQYWLKTGKRQTVRVEAPLPKQFVNFAKQAGLSLPSPAPVIPKAT